MDLDQDKIDRVILERAKLGGFKLRELYAVLNARRADVQKKIATRVGGLKRRKLIVFDPNATLKRNRSYVITPDNQTKFEEELRERRVVSASVRRNGAVPGTGYRDATEERLERIEANQNRILDELREVAFQVDGLWRDWFKAEIKLASEPPDKESAAALRVLHESGKLSKGTKEKEHAK